MKKGERGWAGWHGYRNTGRVRKRNGLGVAMGKMMMMIGCSIGRGNSHDPDWKKNWIFLE